MGTDADAGWDISARREEGEQTSGRTVIWAIGKYRRSGKPLPRSITNWRSPISAVTAGILKVLLNPGVNHWGDCWEVSHPN
ncbi:hypothetical protein PHLCEN_2v3499 [Hermanssonia centrifuga]|uniref:Uncharacterized protein n=1 Tax=Hermanssonia centrifuga TaxID=98765 RepID=A0A2R6QF01_9APHY|nr:hypothetical protein PHLCEN_2v3499 [Hermanssonia centrifuga]